MKRCIVQQTQTGALGIVTGVETPYSVQVEVGTKGKRQDWSRVWTKVVGHVLDTINDPAETCHDGTGPDEPSDRGFVCAHQAEAERLREELKHALAAVKQWTEDHGPEQRAHAYEREAQLLINAHLKSALEGAAKLTLEALAEAEALGRERAKP